MSSQNRKVVKLSRSQKHGGRFEDGFDGGDRVAEPWPVPNQHMYVSARELEDSASFFPDPSSRKLVISVFVVRP